MDNQALHIAFITLLPGGWTGKANLQKKSLACNRGHAPSSFKVALQAKANPSSSKSSKASKSKNGGNASSNNKELRDPLSPDALAPTASATEDDEASKRKRRSAAKRLEPTLPSSEYDKSLISLMQEDYRTPLLKQVREPSLREKGKKTKGKGKYEDSDSFRFVKNATWAAIGACVVVELLVHLVIVRDWIPK